MSRARRGLVPRLVVGLASVLTASSCGGPDVPFEVAMKEVPSDVVLGAPEEKPSPVPLPPTALDVALAPRGGSVGPPRFRPEPASFGPTSTTTTAPAPPACPAADRHDVPALAAELYVDELPAPATYEYRNEGTITVGGVDASLERYSVLSTRRVQDVRSTPGGFTFDVLATLGDTATLTSYRVVRDGPLPSDPGLFITSVTTTEADGSVHRFQPLTPVTLLKFPAENGATWAGAAADGANGVTMTYQASIGEKQRVDACGSLVDAVAVTLTGEIVEGGREHPAARFTALYAVATQYGGITVMDDVDITRTHSSGSVNRRNQATVNRVPEPGTAP